MKTYYAVTEGEYSDYRIITITEDKEKAERIAAAYDGDVEEYEDCIINPIGIWKIYHYEKNGDWIVYHSERDVEDIKDVEWKPDYFESTLFNEGMTWTIYVTAENKERAQKIAYDKYAQWKAEREGLA